MSGRDTGNESSRESEHSHIDLDAANRRLREHVDESLDRLRQARADIAGSYVSYGASNYPHDPDFWAADWHDLLPLDDPRRVGVSIVRNGTPGAYHSMHRAHSAIREAYGLPPEDESSGDSSAGQTGAL